MVPKIKLSAFVTSNLLLCAGLLIATTGCSTLNQFSNTALPTESKSPSLGMYQVEMSGAFGKTTVFQGEIDGPITVQTALERSGATTKFRGMDIMVYRVVQETGRGLKMPVSYNKKIVSSETDYALHPNDRIVVQSRSINPLDKLVDALNPGN